MKTEVHMIASRYDSHSTATVSAHTHDNGDGPRGVVTVCIGDRGTIAEPAACRMLAAALNQAAWEAERITGELQRGRASNDG